MSNPSAYKHYVENHKIPLETEYRAYTEDLCSACDKFNARGELDLNLQDLFEYDPRAMLGLLFGAPRFASDEVRLTLEEAFCEYIDPINGGFTQAGETKFGRGCGWLTSYANAHRNATGFAKIRHDPVAVAAWPIKGRVAKLR